jgi:hypothetical protein
MGTPMMGANPQKMLRQAGYKAIGDPIVTAAAHILIKHDTRGLQLGIIAGRAGVGVGSLYS